MKIRYLLGFFVLVILLVSSSTASKTFAAKKQKILLTPKPTPMMVTFRSASIKCLPNKLLKQTQVTIKWETTYNGSGDQFVVEGKKRGTGEWTVLDILTGKVSSNHSGKYTYTDTLTLPSDITPGFEPGDNVVFWVHDTTVLNGVVPGSQNKGSVMLCSFNTDPKKINSRASFTKVN